MDEPASSATDTLDPAIRKPRPLTKLQKWICVFMAAVGLVLVVVTFYLLESNLPGFVIGGMAGAGGSLLAMSFLMLFHRPDR